jgi:DNA-binding response OmpR family regulator
MIVTLPPEEGTPMAGKFTASAATAAGSADKSALPKKRVLLVDDEDSLTMLFQIALERTGRFEVRIENRGRQAVASALEFAPDLIFLDWHLPDKEGTEIAAEFQAEGSLKSVPVVFLTGAMSTLELEQHNARGGFEAISKPIDRRHFVNRALELVGFAPAA